MLATHSRTARLLVSASSQHPVSRKYQSSTFRYSAMVRGEQLRSRRSNRYSLAASTAVPS